MSKYSIDDCDVYVDLRKFDLSDRLGIDMISIDRLLTTLEEALDKIDVLKEKIDELSYIPEDDIDGRMDDKRLGIL